MRLKLFVIAFFLLEFAVFHLSAQNLVPDTIASNTAAGKAIDYFNKTIADRSEIFNGTQYDLFPPANKGTFYFQDKNYSVPSLIKYNGTWYKNVPVLYDVHTDGMISNLGDNLFILSPLKITEVYLLSHHFVNLDHQTAANLNPGFYDLLYDGKSTVVVKLNKTIDDHTTVLHTVEVFYINKSDVYVKSAGVYYPVSSRGDLVDVFKDKKKAVKQYIKDHKIDFNKDLQTAVVTVANYYDTISN